MAPNKFGFGQSVRRKEDDPLLRGAGRYVADATPADALHAVVVRSTHAHARFRLDTAKARAMPGVRLILTGDDIDEVGLMPMQAGIPGVDIPVPRYPVLAQGEVRHVGDAVAFVVADTLEQAKDAAEAIDIEWQPLPHVIGAVAALEQGAVQVWPDRPGNLAFEVALGDQASTAKAMARARAHRVADAGQPAPGHQLSRHPRRHRRVRRGRRPPDADARQPGQPLSARHLVRDAQAAAGENARGDA